MIAGGAPLQPRTQFNLPASQPDGRIDDGFLKSIIETQELLEQRTHALQALAESEERFRGAFENASIGMALVGLDGRWLQVNPSCCQIVGYSESELLDTDFQSISHPQDLHADLEFVRQLIAGKVRSYRMVKRYFHKSGRIVWVVLSVSLVRNVEGHPLYFVSQIQDISESKRRESLEADQRQILEMVARDHPLDPTLEKITQMLERQIEGATASFLVIRDGGLCHIAPNLPKDMVAGMKPHKLSMAAALVSGGAGPHRSLMNDDQVWAPVREIALASGLRVCWAQVIRSGEGDALGLLTLYCRNENPLEELDDESIRAAANLATIAIEHHVTAQRLSHLTRHDPLTGLPNRILLEDRVGQALALAARNGTQVGIMALDLDHFKQINDTFGHQVGDHLLQLFAQRLRSHLRASDTLARTGGDELMAVLPDMPGPDGAAAVANKLILALREPFTIGGQTINATASIGIAIYPLDGKDPVTVQAQADAALYRAKGKGRNGYSF
jgi:diguanylate cyclase (GGDEF)-like protein/PAS domain S-box-containing protein